MLHFGRARLRDDFSTGLSEPCQNGTVRLSRGSHECVLHFCWLCSPARALSLLRTVLNRLRRRGHTSTLAPSRLKQRSFASRSKTASCCDTSAMSSEHLPGRKRESPRSTYSLRAASGFPESCNCTVAVSGHYPKGGEFATRPRPYLKHGASEVDADSAFREQFKNAVDESVKREEQDRN